MLNINHFKKLTGAVLFLIAGAGLTNAQNTPKFDRNFRAIYENTIQAKNSNILPLKDIGPEKLDTKTTKSGQILFSCIIYTTKPEALKAKGIQVQSILPKFVTALISAEDLIILKDMPEVTFVKSPKEIPPTNDISVANSGAALLQAGALNKTSYTGKGVLVGILDSGIDWKHPDFRNPTDQTKSRIVRMWDQMIKPTGTEASPSGFSYGVEYTQDQISAELAGSTTGTIRETDQQGHGTHVAGTAAGNGAAIYSGTTYTLSGAKYKGMAPEADLVIVRGASTGGFSSTNVINGLTYFKNVSAALNKPIVVNMSLGGHYSAHDGTDDQEVAIDNFTASGPGRVVAIAAGNEGGTNIHKKDVLAPGSSTTTNFVIPTNTTATPVLGYVVYANAADKLNAVFTDPTGATINLPLDSDTGNSGSLINNNSFRVYADNYVDPSNNKRFIDIYITRESGSTTDAAGTYSLRIDNTGSTTSTLNGWLFSNKADGTLTGGDSQYIVGTPGNASSAITVAAYNSKIAWFSKNSTGSAGYAYPYRQDDIASFSSVGPRVDGVLKPEITGAGNLVVSSLASGTLPASNTGNVDGTYYQIMSGTSMATPGVAGSIALMLQLKPGSTASQIKNYLTANAQTDAITGTVPNSTWGYGKLDVFQAASDMNGTKLKRRTYINETPVPYTTADDGNAPLSTQRIAESFTPDITGKLGGIYFHTLSDAGAGGSYSLTGFTIEIHESNNGVPGALLTSKSVDPTYISKLSWNYINLSDLDMKITKNKDFFVVLYTGNGSKWGVRRFSTNPNNRSQISSDNGTTWSAASVGYRIRAVAYEDSSVLAVNEVNNSAKLAVYPNPATDILHLRLPKNEKSKIRIYDLSGRQVKAMEGNSENIDIAVASLTSGAYLVSVETPTLKTTEKFIKK